MAAETDACALSDSIMQQHPTSRASKLAVHSTCEKEEKTTLLSVLLSAQGLSAVLIRGGGGVYSAVCWTHAPRLHLRRIPHSDCSCQPTTCVDNYARVACLLSCAGRVSIANLYLWASSVLLHSACEKDNYLSLFSQVPARSILTAQGQLANIVLIIQGMGIWTLESGGTLEAG